MIKHKTTEAFRSLILSGEGCEFLKDGWLDVDEIRISHTEMKLLWKGELLWTIGFGTWFDHKDGSTLTMKWDSPHMRFKIDLEDR